jgi:hypothetical protein
LIGSKKEVHHVQIAPTGLEMTDEQWEDHYFPGNIYYTSVVEDSIIAGKYVKKSEFAYNYEVDL